MSGPNLQNQAVRNDEKQQNNSQSAPQTHKELSEIRLPSATLALAQIKVEEIEKDKSIKLKNTQYPDRSITLSEYDHKVTYRTVEELRKRGFDLSFSGSAKSADRYSIINHKGKTVGNVHINHWKLIPRSNQIQIEVQKFLSKEFGPEVDFDNDINFKAYDLDTSELKKDGVSRIKSINLGKEQVLNLNDGDNTARIEIETTKAGLLLKAYMFPEDGKRKIGELLIAKGGEILSLKNRFTPAPHYIAEADPKSSDAMVIDSEIAPKLHKLISSMKEKGYSFAIEFDSGKAFGIGVRKDGKKIGSVSVNGVERLRGWDTESLLRDLEKLNK